MLMEQKLQTISVLLFCDRQHTNHDMLPVLHTITKEDKSKSMTHALDLYLYVHQNVCEATSIIVKILAISECKSQ